MIKYIVKDLTAAANYLPHGIAAGVVIVLLLRVVNDRRVRRQKTPFSVASVTALLVYMFIVLCITFLSRESGSSNGIDMEFFSTWGINDRNNAFVIENILLFIPYGFLVPWVVPGFRNLFSCLLLGLTTCLGIEYMQLITARGYFQVDDILTNTLGTILGYIIFKIYTRIRRK